MRDPKFSRVVEATAVLLFLLQAVRVLFSVLFGIIYDTIIEEILPMTVAGTILGVTVLAFALPWAAPRRRWEKVLWAAAVVAALARVPVTFNHLWVRLWGSLVVIAAGGLYTATLIRHAPFAFAPALVAGLVADQFLRTLGNTFDLSLRSWWWPVQLALVVGVAVVGRWAMAGDKRDNHKGGNHKGYPFYGAVGALLFLETSLLDFPNGIARWTGIPYEIVAPFLLAVTLLPLFAPVRRVVGRLFRGPLGGLGFVLLVLTGVAAGRMVGGVVGMVGMLVAQFLLLLIPFGLTRSPVDGRKGDHKGVDHKGRLYLGFLLFLVVSFVYAFTFVYAYTIPAFEGMGLPIILLLALIAALPALRRSFFQPEKDVHPPTLRQNLIAALVVVVTLPVLSPCFTTWHMADALRVGTYNIHYGYSTTWQLNLEEIARTIEESGASVVMLQEVDTCRITSYGVDNLYWLSRRLGMRTAIYQPTLEALSGYGLLSNYPSTGSGGAVLDSELDPGGLVHARLQVAGRSLDAYSTWLGLTPEERARQLTDALVYIGDAAIVVWGGDFNAMPDSPVYARIVEAGFIDPFPVVGLDPVAFTSPAIEPNHRIDFVWGRGVEPVSAEVLDSLASDHRMVITEWTLR